MARHHDVASEFNNQNSNLYARSEPRDGAVNLVSVKFSLSAALDKILCRQKNAWAWPRQIIPIYVISVYKAKKIEKNREKTSTAP